MVIFFVKEVLGKYLQQEKNVKMGTRNLNLCQSPIRSNREGTAAVIKAARNKDLEKER